MITSIIIIIIILIGVCLEAGFNVPYAEFTAVCIAAAYLLIIIVKAIYIKAAQNKALKRYDKRINYN